MKRSANKGLESSIAWRIMGEEKRKYLEKSTNISGIVESSVTPAKKGA